MEHVVAWKKEDPKTRNSTVFPTFLTFDQWLLHDGGIPGMEVLYKAWESAFFTPGSAGKLSKNEYLTRELQSVGIMQDVSSDHTFSAADNADASVKQQWEMVAGTGEIVAATFTKSTVRGELLHMMESLLHRPDVHIQYWCFDNWPNDKSALAVLCPNVVGYQGAFHWMDRLRNLMKKTHKDFRSAMRALRDAVWDYEL